MRHGALTLMLLAASCASGEPSGSAGASARVHELTKDIERSETAPGGAAAKTPASTTASLPVAPRPDGLAPLVEGPIGSAHPTFVSAVAPNGSWVVLCQARRDEDGDGKIEVLLGRHGDILGDRVELYWIVGDGLGVPIDALLGFDPSGRHVAFAKDGHLVLADAHSQRQTRLTPLSVDVAKTLPPAQPHLLVDFDADGLRMLYLERATGSWRLVVRDLASGRATRHPLRGLPQWAQFDDDATKVVVGETTTDDNGNGKLDPLPPANRWLALSNNPWCAAPVTALTTYGSESDAVQTRTIAVPAPKRSLARQRFERSSTSTAQYRCHETKPELGVLATRMDGSALLGRAGDDGHIIGPLEWVPREAVGDCPE